MSKIKINIIFVVVMLFPFNVNAQTYQGKYCELDGVVTDSGKSVTGECYMYSDKYGELESVQTENGESVSGECYRYSEHALESAETESGESISGECYFYE